MQQLHQLCHLLVPWSLLRISHNSDVVTGTGCTQWNQWPISLTQHESLPMPFFRTHLPTSCTISHSEEPMCGLDEHFRLTLQIYSEHEAVFHWVYDTDEEDSANLEKRRFLRRTEVSEWLCEEPLPHQQVRSRNYLCCAKSSTSLNCSLEQPICSVHQEWQTPQVQWLKMKMKLR